MKSAGLSPVLLLALAGCSTTSERPVQPMRPASSAELAMGYQEAVDLGSRYVMERGLADAQFEGAEQLNANIWRVRFGKGPDGVLHLYFDGMQKTLIKAEEIQGIRGRPVTVPLVPPAKTR